MKLVDKVLHLIINGYLHFYDDDIKQAKLESPDYFSRFEEDYYKTTFENDDEIEQEIIDESGDEETKNLKKELLKEKKEVIETILFRTRILTDPTFTDIINKIFFYLISAITLISLLLILNENLDFYIKFVKSSFHNFIIIALYLFIGTIICGYFGTMIFQILPPIIPITKWFFKKRLIRCINDELVGKIISYKAYRALSINHLKVRIADLSVFMLGLLFWLTNPTKEVAYSLLNAHTTNKQIEINQSDLKYRNFYLFSVITKKDSSDPLYISFLSNGVYLPPHIIEED